MQKVINNLLSNAIKHTGGRYHYAQREEERRDNVVIRVKDAGSGIDAKEIDKIFDRFYQIDQLTPPMPADRCRYGLALTKGIVELHHGTIRVESELGKGTSFIVTHFA